MRNIIIVSALLLSGTSSFGQLSECDLLNKGISYYEAENYDSTLICWKQVIENFPDTSVCYGRSFNNITFAYLRQEELDSAKLWLQKILDSDLNDLDEGTNIMAPYANYKHNACLTMSNLLMDEGNFQQSFKYLHLGETTFPYQTFSATSFEKKAVVLAYKRAEIWTQKGDKKKALLVMLEKILDVDVFFRKTDAASYTNLNFYLGLINDAIPLAEEIYGKKELNKKLKKAIKKLTAKDVTIGEKNSEARLASFTLDGHEFSIGVTEADFSVKDFQKYLLNNQLFQYLKK